ncbi:MAG: hypothetical protein QF535_19075 [Anaerolineales bacterium]|jgi:hypothetical protein|nr:hypothetical protein [Anaerolineales bacterium]
MAGTITTGNFPRLLQEGINATFDMNYNEREMAWKYIFDEKGSSKAFEVDVQTEGFGLAAAKPEGQEIQFDSRRQGFTPKYIHTTYAKGFVVTEEMMEDDLYQQAFNDAGSLGRSMRITEEVVSHNVINRAFNAAFTMPDGDGQSLISTAHQFGPTNTGTYSNRVSTDSAFSETALESLLIQIDKADDARGLPIMLQAMKLIGAPEQRFEFERVLGSVLQNDTANNAVNAMNAMGSVRDGWITSVYLTSPTAWFVKTDCPEGLCSFNRRALTFGEDNSFTTGNARFKATQRYSKGWSNPRGIYGSTGTA